MFPFYSSLLPPSVCLCKWSLQEDHTRVSTLLLQRQQFPHSILNLSHLGVIMH
ncbi:hypothetical protein I3843_05G218600 [Carya illinoinensis]|nr:hypothetical protein I3843_05G218600 [Carya illinoinensis]